MAPSLHERQPFRQAMNRTKKTIRLKEAAPHKPLPALPENEAAWVSNLRKLMEKNGFNPRSLSLKAGLNATAVRDMLEHRTRFPRYDTIEALAQALQITPSQLMEGKEALSSSSSKTPTEIELELLTEVITRLHEVAEDLNRTLSPREFAAMAMTIFGQLLQSQNKAHDLKDLKPKISNLIEYESLRGRDK